MKKLAENYGTGDSDALTIRTKLMLEELTLYRTELARNQFENPENLRRVGGAKSVVGQLESMEVPASELMYFLQMDPQAKKWIRKSAIRRWKSLYNRKSVQTRREIPWSTKYEEELELLQKKYDERVDEVRKKAQEKRRLAIALDVLKLETLLSTMQEQQKTSRRKSSRCRARP